ncbi:hypothetical protein KJY73_15605 [Bowmanella sp. Y26]|uniref:hypothetical protein n=1 Tax=Bowmanella yangjiangensis TaxID=2811230 RepID=UPI001BDBCF27|nr:hypothetical protein [Bowmanella yangjiangensis]MBT1065017.1 hypothetical protein [Bowmanella yangjiangensis]
MTQTPDFSLLDASLVTLSVLLVIWLLRPAVKNSAFWQATVTPLASIIGSGFLVVVPLLANIAGHWAWLAIIVIVLLSWWLGSAMRYSMQTSSLNQDAPDKWLMGLERFADVALAIAYVISITFYIRLMAGFLLTGLDIYSEFNADVLASMVLLSIGFYGLLRGLHGLERLEEYSVSIKLAIIAALLGGLLWQDVQQGYHWHGLSSPDQPWWQSLCQLGGMLLIVQGFETSKYLASQYPLNVRVRSMSVAQILAGLIYIGFVVLAMPYMGQFVGTQPSETAIITVSAQITLVLPVMLIVAAAMSQFSAAIADTIGAGGVVEQQSRSRINARNLYPVITLFSVTLLWSANIFQLVSYASRAFAFYYLLQSLLAARQSALREHAPKRVASYLGLAFIMLLIVVFAEAVEGH